jgi:hypothetical protein
MTILEIYAGVQFYFQISEGKSGSYLEMWPKGVNCLC